MAGLQCPRCSTIVYPTPGSTPVCPSCGFRDAAANPAPRPAPAPPPQAAYVPPPSPPMYATPAAGGWPSAPAPAAGHAPGYPTHGGHGYATPSTYHTAPGYPGPPPYPAPPANRPSQTIAIVALLLNAIVWPGLGSLIAGRQVGWAQGFLFLLGAFLVVIIVGIFLMIPVWIWGIVTGVQLIQQASATPA